MASSARTWRHNVYASFHGPDVRKTFRKQFSSNGITIFDEQGIERSNIQAIRESRISIVVFSKNYASSSWCLDELVEILKCRENMGQLVVPIFYGVDQSHVRKQTGDFGSVFRKTCSGKTEEVTRRWIHALTNASTIVGEDFRNWNNEAEMIEKIAKDISNKLNVTPNRDFEDMVGIEAHLHKMQFFLQLDSEDGAKIVGISGPAGVGKTTIARALHSRLSSRFQLTCFMENLKGSSNSGGLDDYGLKLRLQEQLLSKILNQKDIQIYHLGAIRERLDNLKVLIILDDVDDLKQLEALADETSWFGPGSRIIVTTEDKVLLQKHGIDVIYHVGFPSSEEALEILCRHAFRQSSPPDGFEELAKRVTKLCSNLPSDLRVVGSSLRGKKEEEWEDVMRLLETNHDHQNIEQVLRPGYQPPSSNKPGKKEEEWGEVTRRVETYNDHRDIDHVLSLGYEPPSSNKRIGKSRWSTGMAFLVIINLLVEIASAIADQLSSIHFARISLAMSVLSAVLSILDLIFKIRFHKASYRCKGPIPWFFYPPRRYNKIIGNLTDTVLLFCVFGHLGVAGINYNSIQKRQDAPINVLVWPLFFAIGMVISKFMEKPIISEDTLPIAKMY